MILFLCLTCEYNVIFLKTMNYFKAITKLLNPTIRINTGFRKIVYLEYFYICGKIDNQ